MSLPPLPLALLPQGHEAAAGLAPDVPLLACGPFALLLLCIAVLPLAAPHFWESNRNKGIVGFLLALPIAVWAGRVLPGELADTGLEYLSFMVLLGSLFVVSAGLLLEGDLLATPRTNAAFLGAGALLASFIGTTGAAMLLIRPLLRTNSERRHVLHTVIFFIFMVCNTGGCLTPLGDPPLFVGYLQGVPFTWTFTLWPEWLAVNGILLALYLLADAHYVRKETPEALALDRVRTEPLRLSGLPNLALLAVIVASVATLDFGWREAAMVGAALLSLRITRKEIHQRNAFNWGPIIEVGVLFAAIFVTMVPALEYLREHGAELGVRSPMAFFWTTGSLSSVLDNTPTYLTFLSLARGLALPDQVAGTTTEVLRAISLGAVFMGAMTYIGNGPNFMVKAIADGQRVRMPGFFGYLLVSCLVLLPVLGLMPLLFLT